MIQENLPKIEKKKKMEQHVRRTHVPENTDPEQPISTETLLV